MIVGGFAVMGFAALFALGTVVLFDSIYPIWVGLLLLGGGTSRRAWLHAAPTLRGSRPGREAEPGAALKVA